MLFFIGLWLIASPAYAGAWLQEEGHGQLITTATTYRAEHFRGKDGDAVNARYYAKNELNPYGEYGLTKNWTVGFSALLNQSSAGILPTGGAGHYFFGQAEFFARTKIYETNNWVVSLEPLIKLPPHYYDSALEESVEGDADAQLALLVGTNIKWLGYKHYLDTSLAYRKRSGAPNDQMKAAITLGTHYSEDLDILSQVFYTDAEKFGSKGITFRLEDDYNLLKLQLSGLYKLSDEVALQAGYFVEPYARNAGLGQGGLLALWYKF